MISGGAWSIKTINLCGVKWVEVSDLIYLTMERGILGWLLLNLQSKSFKLNPIDSLRWITCSVETLFLKTNNRSNLFSLDGFFFPTKNVSIISTIIPFHLYSLLNIWKKVQDSQIWSNLFFFNFSLTNLKNCFSVHVIILLQSIRMWI